MVTRATTPERAENAPRGDDSTRPLGNRTIPLKFVVTRLDPLAGSRVVVSGLLIGADGVDGINVKLVKCGGIRGALAMIHTARAMGFKIMLGCMLESQILTTAAAHLSPLVDWADLDGPFLTARDPFTGIQYADGKIVLPDGPGLGVREREESVR